MLKRIREMNDQDGFTLIELMVVVLIIAILIAIAIPTFLGLRERAQNRSAQSDLRNGMTAAKAFYTDGETYTGFEVGTTAEDIEPSLTWTTGAAAEGVVDIETSAGNTARLVTLSASGAYFCIQDVGGTSGFGVSDDATPTAAEAVTACGGTAW